MRITISICMISRRCLSQYQFARSTSGARYTKKKFSSGIITVVLIEIEVNGKKYYADESKMGNIYKFLEDGEIGDEIGHYVNGEPIIF